ncbi:hypothetical protein SCHPADRAFT_998699 [Schizopora paradoxa]|uniref:Uncharacterized protein n=1 Tax=Schizopora paradoxa TaxID=27342 RepID=A0A0H2RQF6_9AGAM|nr:hypothetical protein SCHPADRAFT_998699 [Schizopora paradoxa]
MAKITPILDSEDDDARTTDLNSECEDLEREEKLGAANQASQISKPGASEAAESEESQGVGIESEEANSCASVEPGADARGSEINAQDRVLDFLSLLEKQRKERKMKEETKLAEIEEQLRESQIQLDNTREELAEQKRWIAGLAMVMRAGEREVDNVSRLMGASDDLREDRAMRRDYGGAREGLFSHLFK